MPIKLVSTSRRPQTFNLMCQATRIRRDTFEYDPGTGQRHTKRGYIRMPASITLRAKGRPGSRTKLLPDAAALEDEIVAAERKGLVKVIRVSNDAAEAEKADERRKAKKAERRRTAKAGSKKTKTTRGRSTSRTTATAATDTGSDAPTETKTETRGPADD